MPNKPIETLCVPALILAALVVSSVSLSGCSDPKARTLAKVNGKAITVGEFETRLSKMPAYYKALASQRKKDFLDDMISEQLMYKEAVKRGLNRDREVKELIEEARSKILVAKLLETEGRKTAVSEEKINEFYQMHKDDFVTPLKMRASHIMVDTEAEAREVQQKLNAGGDFAQLAREYSKDPSKDRGGDIGYFVKGQLMPQIEEVALDLQVGQTSDIIRTKFGYHIIRMTEKIEPRTVELPEVRDAIEKELKDLSQKRMMDDMIRSLRSKAHIKINEKLLDGEAK
ncbi:MAG: peptidylprolyl isomerase [Candidatus Omnitrophota bacterium]|jgi:peptidyl-prolyl cis-trans isomerase C